ncbi:MAG: hypothetical protein GX557_02710 [Chloroflexi bacterium]|nr:hypothetical protein [Chloroflexota bacterium]
MKAEDKAWVEQQAEWRNEMRRARSGAGRRGEMTEWVKREHSEGRHILYIEWDAIEQLQRAVAALKRARRPARLSLRGTCACDVPYKEEAEDLRAENENRLALLAEGAAAIKVWPEPATWTDWAHRELESCEAFAQARRIDDWLAAVAALLSRDAEGPVPASTEEPTP